MTTVLYTLEAAARTHTGLVRRRNEDALYAGRALFAVADGLGGHAAGDVASAAVIKCLAEHDQPAAPEGLADILGHAIYAANEVLHQQVEAHPTLTGMGSTLVAMLWSHSTYVVANVGDSRGYVLHAADGELVQITEDHTYANLVAEAASVPNLPAKISRFLDGRLDGRSPDLTARELHAGDRFLLCSDGLSGVVSVDRIRDVLAGTANLNEAADRLVELALEEGGQDNITVIIVDVSSTEGGNRDE